MLVVDYLNVHFERRMRVDEKISFVPNASRDRFDTLHATRIKNLPQ